MISTIVVVGGDITRGQDIEINFVCFKYFKTYPEVPVNHCRQSVLGLQEAVQLKYIFSTLQNIDQIITLFATL